MRTSTWLLAALLAAPAAQAGVIVVDLGGGGDFQNLTDAVAAAANGDTIFVHAGEYVEPAPVLIDGKALTIVGEWPGDFAPKVTVQPGLVVRNLAPGENTFVLNLTVFGAPSTSTTLATAAVTVRDNVAHLRLQDCTLLGGYGNHNNNLHGAPAVDVANSISTALVGCFVVGGTGQFSPDLGVKTGNGGAGVALAGGQVYLGETFALGGDGGSNIIGGWPDGGKGGAGVLHSSGSLLFTASFASGGTGGTAHHGGDGGDGLVLGGSGIAWLLAGSVSSGGSGGSSDKGPDGDDGVDLVDPAGLVTDFGGSQVGFRLTSPLGEGQVGMLELGGAPGDSTLLFASVVLHQLPLPGYDGVLLLAPTSLIGPFVIGPPGNVDVPFAAPVLPAGVQSLLVHVQPAYVGVGGTELGTGRVLIILDSGF